jgi:hypothetical protein
MEKCNSIVPFQCATDLGYLGLPDNGAVVGSASLLATGQLCDVNLEQLRNLRDGRELVQAANAALDLVHPTLRLPQSICEHLL